MNKKWYRRRKRLLEILEVGYDLDHVSRAYDFLSAFAIVLNLTASIMYSFDNLQAQFGSVLLWIERITDSKRKYETGSRRPGIHLHKAPSV